MNRTHSIDSFPADGAPIQLPAGTTKVDALLYRDGFGTTHWLLNLSFDAAACALSCASPWPADAHPTSPNIRAHVVSEPQAPAPAPAEEPPLQEPSQTEPPLETAAPTEAPAPSRRKLMLPSDKE